MITLFILGALTFAVAVSVALVVFAGSADEVPTPPAPPRPTPRQDAVARLTAANGHVHSLSRRLRHARRERDVILLELSAIEADEAAADWAPPRGIVRPT